MKTINDELTVLRTSMKRIAQVTKDAEIIAAIPEGDMLGYAERGWNALAARLCDWVDSIPKPDFECHEWSGSTHLAPGNTKTVYLWIADYGMVQPEHYPKPFRNIDASLFFSSVEKFKELWPWKDDPQQLVPVQVPADFDQLDFIPDNY